MKRTFAQALEEALKSRGWTPYRLAQEAGVTRSGLSLYLSGQRVPEPDTIAAVAAKLGVDDDELQALADIHRLGDARVERIIRYFSAADPSSEVKVEAEGGRPLSGKERVVVQRLRLLAPDLSSIGLGSESYVWELPAGARLRELLATERDVREVRGMSQEEAQG